MTNRGCSLICLGLLVVLMAGCASSRPVLYSADRGGPPGGDRAVADCMDRAEVAGLDYSKGRVRGSARGVVEDSAVGAAGGAAGGAIFGNAGRGAAAGAAGGAAASVMRGLLSGFGGDRGPAPAYKAYVDRCLRDRGYDPVGWN